MKEIIRKVFEHYNSLNLSNFSINIDSLQRDTMFRVNFINYNIVRMKSCTVDIDKIDYYIKTNFNIIEKYILKKEVYILFAEAIVIFLHTLSDKLTIIKQNRLYDDAVAILFSNGIDDIHNIVDSFLKNLYTEVIQKCDTTGRVYSYPRDGHSSSLFRKYKRYTLKRFYYVIYYNSIVY